MHALDPCWRFNVMEWYIRRN